MPTLTSPPPTSSSPEGSDRVLTELPEGLLERLPPREDRPGRTRLVKDIAAVGFYPALVRDPITGEPQPVNLTADKLAAIASSFEARFEAGERCPLTWNHPQRDANSRLSLHPRDKIAEIEAVVLFAGRLWTVSYPTTADAEALVEGDHVASMGVLENGVDHQGRRHDIAIDHVAVVLHPAIPDQVQFLDLAAADSTSAASEPSASPAPKGTAVTAAELTGPINRLLDYVKPGASLPNTTTDESLANDLDFAVSLLLGGEGGGEEVAEAASEATVSSVDLSKPDEQAGKLAVLEAKEAVREELVRVQAAQAYEQQVNALNLPAALRQRAMDLGKATGHDVSHLSIFEGQALPDRAATHTDAAPNTGDERDVDSLKKLGKSLCRG